MLLADANHAAAIDELTKLTQSRRQAFAVQVQAWRSAYADWKERSNILIAEAQTERMMGKNDDFSDEPIPHEFPFLLELPTQKFSWGRFIALDENKRYTDNRYRLGGPPRPMFKVALDEHLELFPLFCRVRDKTR